VLLFTCVYWTQIFNYEYWYEASENPSEMRSSSLLSSNYEGSVLTVLNLSLSQNVVPPEGKFNVNLLLQTFKDETIDFVRGYFEDTEIPEERIVDFDEALDDMKRLLKDISKTKRHQTL